MVLCNNYNEYLYFSLEIDYGLKKVNYYWYITYKSYKLKCQQRKLSMAGILVVWDMR